jgi:hypothetical protein
MRGTPPPTLQQQTARKQIKILRQKLLDITNRNPLASFRHSDVNGGEKMHRRGGARMRQPA